MNPLDSILNALCSITWSLSDGLFGPVTLEVSHFAEIVINSLCRIS